MNTKGYSLALLLQLVYNVNISNVSPLVKYPNL